MTRIVFPGKACVCLPAWLAMLVADNVSPVKCAQCGADDPDISRYLAVNQPCFLTEEGEPPRIHVVRVFLCRDLCQLAFRSRLAGKKMGYVFWSEGPLVDIEMMRGHERRLLSHKVIEYYGKPTGRICPNGTCGNRETDGLEQFMCCPYCYTERYCSNECMLDAWKGGHGKTCGGLNDNRLC